MCGRFTVAKDIRKISKFFGVTPPDGDFPPRFNAAPMQELPVISNECPEQVSLYRWGLVPFWAADEKIANKLINARSETVLQKPAFRKAVQSHRCLVLADGFYEWKKTGRRKIPYRFVLKNDEPFAFAGIWDRWRAPDGRELKTFSILTTEANALVKDVHDRMPVLFDRETADAWIHADLSGGDIEAMLIPFPAELMRGYPVSDRVNSPKNDSPELIKPADREILELVPELDFAE